MSLATALCRANVGIQAPLVTVEAHLSNGLPCCAIVGLPEAAVRESRERIRSAIINSGFEFPRRRLTINLAPADLPKGGGRYDLAIAMALLAASGQIDPASLKHVEFFAELSLLGELRGAAGVLPVAIAASAEHHRLVVAYDNQSEAALPEQAIVHGARTLAEVCRWLREGCWPAPQVRTDPEAEGRVACSPDLDEVRGQEQARRALEIAAAGGHNLLLCGPPGAGKSMLASCMPGLLPELDTASALETAALYSVGGQQRAAPSWVKPPFRSPHHSASAVALVGGGSMPRPGEISLAHNGVLFLDELPEFERRVLEVLREPLETGSISISRAARQAQYPARFQLLAAMNPCPCGYAGDPQRCQCRPGDIDRYRRRVSGPLLDRIDLRLQVPALPVCELLAERPASECSAAVRARVRDCRHLQLARQHCLNAHLRSAAQEQVCDISGRERGFLQQALERLQISARSWHRVLRVSRTIADLAGSTQIQRAHLLEALSLRAAGI